MVLVGFQNPKEDATWPKGAGVAQNGHEKCCPYLAEGEDENPKQDQEGGTEES